MGGAAKDSARAVIHQDEIGDPHRQFDRGVQRMFHPQAGINPDLLCRLNLNCRGATLAAQSHKLRHFRIAFQRLGQRVICRNGGKRCAQKRIGAGGVNL